MTENMKKFLETVSKNDELYNKFTGATKEELIALAKELGIELTNTDFEQPDGELSDDELDAVAGGALCACMLAGSGDDNNSNEKYCVCVAGGGGQFTNGDCRCMCVFGGAGECGE